MTDACQSIPSRLRLAPTAEILPYILPLHRARDAIRHPDPDAELIVCSPKALAVRVPDSSIAHTPEVHTWWDSNHSGETLLHSVSTHAERPFLISASENLPRVSGLPGQSIRELGEILMFREMAECPVVSSSLLRSGEHPGEIAQSGAFSRGVIGYAAKADIELFVMVDESSGGWLARCHVEPRPRHLGEVAGVETHPHHRKRGHAKRMLQTLGTILRRQFCGLLYLSLLQNHSSRTLASRVGFSPVTIYRKYLVT